MSVAEFSKHHGVVAEHEGGLAPRLANIFRQLTRWRAERNAIRRLSNLSDDLLKDMGLTRGEIPEVIRFGRRDVAKLRRD